MNDHEDESAVIKDVCTIQQTVQNVVLLLVLSSTAVLLYGISQIAELETKVHTKVRNHRNGPY